MHDGITVYNPKEDGTWFDADGVKEKFGVTPAQVVDVLALMGDSIDNIKGVPGIGEKGARDLIATYGSLEELLAHAAEVSNKRYREGLLSHAEDARQSRELARIRTDVPVPFEPDAVRYRGASRERCFELFTRLGFRSLVLEYAPTAETVGKDYATVESLDELRALAGELTRAGRFGLRVLADSPAADARRHRRPLVLDRGRATPAMCRWRERRPDEGLFSALERARRRRTGRASIATPPWRCCRPILEDEAIRKVGHDLKFDAIVLARHGVTLRGLDTDVMIASYLLDANRSRIRSRIWRSSTSATRRSAKKTSAAAAPRPSRSPTSRSSARSTTPANAPTSRCSCRRRCRGPAAERTTSQRVYDELEQPLIPVLVDIERAGVRIDTAALGGAGERVDQELSRLAATHLRARGRRVQHQLAQEAVGDPLRPARACAPRRSAGRRRPRRSRRRSKCSRSWR